MSDKTTELRKVALALTLKMLEKDSSPGTNQELITKGEKYYYLDPLKIAECYTKIYKQLVEGDQN